MQRWVAYGVVVVGLVVPMALLARTLAGSDEGDLDHILSSVEDRGISALLEAAAWEGDGVLISAGSSSRRYALGERGAARDLLTEETGMAEGEGVNLLQQEVTQNGERATAVLNVEVEKSHYVGLRVTLFRDRDQWWVDGIRIMS